MRYDQNPLVNKGDLMKAVYTYEERRNVDSALPVEFYRENDTFFYVMNYNEQSLGTIENMLEVAYVRGIVLAYELPEDYFSNHTYYHP